ncbi:hypothetical protein [Nocardioides cynanchi]|uniref:hypothetical protein n=1 Tax=Nocardioides cynanchi TaxID=2558918 RepID=UPI001244BAAC|nr:hypothetical protein [Nocardioides cynanchi]
MAAFDSTLLGDYLLGVLVLAAIALGLAVGMGVQVVTSHRRVRLARHQTMRTYYGRAALHH